MTNELNSNRMKGELVGSKPIGLDVDVNYWGIPKKEKKKQVNHKNMHSKWTKKKHCMA